MKVVRIRSSRDSQVAGRVFPVAGESIQAVFEEMWVSVRVFSDMAM